MKKVSLAASIMALGIGTMSSLLAPVASAATPNYTTSTTKVYMAPAGACSDSNDGYSASKALCSFPQASKVMEQKFDQGARGDFELRLVTNKGAFKTQSGEAGQLPRGQAPWLATTSLGEGASLGD